MKQPRIFLIIIAFSANNCFAQRKGDLLAALDSPILFKGNDTTAFRDPAVLYHNKQFYLFFTLVRVERDKRIYSYIAMSISSDLQHWSKVRILTPKDQALDYSSPGDIIRFKNEWILCLQSYPRPGYYAGQMPRFGTSDARIFIMRSRDLEQWSGPELLKLKGTAVPEKEMGRMIDPYLLEDKDEKSKWWCFYKQNGVSLSYSYDLVNWTYFGHAEAGENVSVLVKDNEYILMHSPRNGIALKRSKDLKTWKNWGDSITLGQSGWDWARGRLTAGTVLDLNYEKTFRKYILFFHGSGPLTEEQGDFDKNSSIGIAWSDDLINWQWPGK